MMLLLKQHRFVCCLITAFLFHLIVLVHRINTQQPKMMSTVQVALQPRMQSIHNTPTKLNEPLQVDKKSFFLLADTEPHEINLQSKSNPTQSSSSYHENELTDEYIALLQNYLEQFGNLHYPKELQQNKIKGIVEILIEVSANGELSRIQLLNPSGDRTLDYYAQKLLKDAAPFPAFPSSLAKIKSNLALARTWHFEG